ncbi:hypothetical protein [Pantoea ananatis]|uniref:hypothetical protein n=1 Tax=Pantoea ananas TaxID=553 RepID=UPI001300237F|nr:hypothetical protein [Pantoea ananatis]
MTSDYSVELYSVGEEHIYRGVAEIKEVGTSLYIYGPSNSLRAVLDKNDIKNLRPIRDNE